MKNTIILLIINLVHCVGLSQSKIVIDTIKSNINITFDVLPTSGVNMYMADLQVCYLTADKKNMLFFEVPNYDVRYKTTKQDYATIKLKNREIRLQNLVESDANGIIQKFTFEMTKDDLFKLLLEGLSKITFYFEPNEDFICKRLDTEKNLNIKYKQVISEQAKITVSTIIANPNKKSLNHLKLWIEGL